MINADSLTNNTTTSTSVQSEQCADFIHMRTLKKNFKKKMFAIYKINICGKQQANMVMQKQKIRNQIKFRKTMFKKKQNKVTQQVVSIKKEDRQNKTNVTPNENTDLAGKNTQNSKKTKTLRKHKS